MVLNSAHPVIEYRLELVPRILLSSDEMASSIYAKDKAQRYERGMGFYTVAS